MILGCVQLTTKAVHPAAELTYIITEAPLPLFLLLFLLLLRLLRSVLWQRKAAMSSLV